MSNETDVEFWRLRYLEAEQAIGRLSTALSAAIGDIELAAQCYEDRAKVENETANRSSAAELRSHARIYRDLARID